MTTKIRTETQKVSIRPVNIKNDNWTIYPKRATSGRRVWFFREKNRDEGPFRTPNEAWIGHEENLISQQRLDNHRRRIYHEKETYEEALEQTAIQPNRLKSPQEKQYATDARRLPDLATILR